MAKRISDSVLMGSDFGRLRFVSNAPDVFTQGGTRKRMARFVCSCGEECVKRLFSVTSGNVKSCGCLGRECRANPSDKFKKSRPGMKHGMCGTPVYRSWRSMLDRCYLTSHPGYPRYGGAGIGVCSEWRRSFENFYKDMGDRDGRMTTLDRIDNTEGYSKENCRWATTGEQARNRKDNLWVVFGGEGMVLTDMAIKTRIPFAKLRREYRKWRTGEEILKHL